jgi:hypothetical protein
LSISCWLNWTGLRFYEAGTGAVVRVNPNGSLETIATGLSFPSGTQLDPTVRFTSRILVSATAAILAGILCGLAPACHTGTADLWGRLMRGSSGGATLR